MQDRAIGLAILETRMSPGRTSLQPSSTNFWLVIHFCDPSRNTPRPIFPSWTNLTSLELLISAERIQSPSRKLSVVPLQVSTAFTVFHDLFVKMTAPGHHQAESTVYSSKPSTENYSSEAIPCLFRMKDLSLIIISRSGWNDWGLSGGIAHGKRHI